MGIFLLIMCLLSFNTGAQELQHEVTVTLKLIQVYVTDSAGNPVTDLKSDDFIVYDNKKLQKITDFERFILFPSEDIKGSQPETKDIDSSTTLKEIMSRKFFLFFDLANNNTKGFLKAQQAALHFINTQLHSSDEVGVLSFSVLKGLTLHEYFTKDRQAIRKAVVQIGKEGRVGRAENFEALIWREMSGESALDASQASPSSSSPGSHLGRLEHKNITKRMLLKITDLAKALRYISGHKHILLFSSGIPYSLIYGIPEGSPAPAADMGLDRFLLNKYEEMLKELSNANTTVFSLNTEALATNMNVPAHMKGEYTLRRISQYTGGKFLGNVQNYAVILDTVQVFTGSYYVLGFYVDETWDGHYHSLKVTVNRPGCKVFAQKGFFNPKHFAKYTKMEKELHLLDLALSESPLLQAPIPLPMIAIPFPIKGDPAVLLMAQVPGKKIGESRGERAEIYFMVFDEKDNILDLKMKKMKISALKGKEGYYYSFMPISPGKYKFRIVIRDMDSGKGAVGRYAMEIPEAPKQGLQVLPPLLLAPGKSGLFLRGYVPKTLDSKFPLLDYFPFDPTSYSPLLGEIPHNTKKLLAVLRCSMWNLSKPLLKFSAALIEQSSERSFSLPISILSGKKEGNLGILLVEFQIPEMEPGDYILEISAVDKASQARSQTSITCRIQ